VTVSTLLPGRTTEVVVRTKRATRAQVWLFTGDLPTDRDDLRVKLAHTRDRIDATARPVGAADATALGRSVYRPGDLHAAFVGPDELLVIACADDGTQFICTGFGSVPPKPIEIVLD
jgi:hypothetical protein